MNINKLAIIAAAGLSMSAGYDISFPYKQKPVTKYDKKKCKSCKYFVKGGKGILGTCAYPFSQRVERVNPMDIACNRYQKRK